MNWRWSLLALAVQQGIVMARQQADRDEVFALANEAALRSGKPLLVAGGPWGDAGIRRLLNWPGHPHGDVCLDLDPNACGLDHFILGDVRDIPFPDGWFGAVYCSHVLEHLPTAADCELAVSELHRVADEVFVCVPGRASVIAWLAPQHHLWVTVEDGRVWAEEFGPRRVTEPLAYQ